MSRVARLWLTVVPAALVADAVVVAVILTSEHQEAQLLLAILGSATGLSFIGAGLIARTRRPLNRTGLLMIAVGFTWFAAGLAAADDSLLWTIAISINVIFSAVFVHLLLAYPSGELGSRLERGVVATGYVLAASSNVLLMLFDPEPVEECDDCPDNALLVTESEPAADALTVLVQGFAAIFLLAVVVTLVRRWRRFTPAGRRAHAPVLLAGAATLFFFAVSVGTQELLPTVAGIVGFAASVAFVAVPFLFLWGLLQSRLARAELGPVMRTHYTLAELDQELRRILRDPTATLLVWLDREQGYIDAEGRPYEIAESGERTVTAIEDEEGPLGALVHDPVLRNEELLADVAGALRMNLQHLRSTAALQASERRSRALLEALPDNMYRISRDGVYLDYHAQDPSQLRLPPEELIGSTVWDYPVPHQTTSDLMAAAERAFETGTVQTFEFEATVADGSKRYREARMTPSGPDEFLLITRDITDRKLAEQELTSSEQRSRALLDAMPDSMFRIGLDGRMRDYRVEPPIRLFRPEEDMIGSDVYDADFPREITDRTMELGRKAIETGEPQMHEYAVELDGELQYQEARISPSGADEFVLIVRDVTERKRQEEELRLSGQRSEALLNALPDAMFRVSRDGFFLDYHATDVSPLVDRAQVIGSNVYDYPIPRELMDRFMGAAEEAFETGERQTLEYVLDDDRGVRYQEARITPSGATEFFVVVRDVTDRKQAEVELSRSEQRSRALLQALPDAIFRLSRDGTFLDFQSSELTPIMDADAIVGANLNDYPIPRELVERIMEAAEAAFETGERQTLEFDIDTEGRVVSQEARITPSGTSEFLVVVRDVTERKQQEVQLQTERDFVAKVVNLAPTYFCVIRADGEIVRYNDTLGNTTGQIDDESVRGRPFQEVFVLPEEVEEFDRILGIANNQIDPGEFELRLRSRSGELLDVLWRGVDIYDETGERRYLLCGLDVTERTRHRQDLERRSEFLSAVGDATPAFLCVLDEHARMPPDPINATLREASGYTAEDIGGQRFTEVFIPPEDVEDVERRFAAVVERGEPHEHESEWVMKDGRRVLVAWTCTPLPKVGDESPYLISGVDVTERVRQREEQAALRRVAVAVATERRAEHVFAVVAEEIGRLLGASGAVLLRYEADGSEVDVVGSWSEEGRTMPDVGSRIPLVGGPVTIVYETRRPVQVDFDSMAPELNEQLRAQGINSVVAAPITVAGRLWGAVSATLAPPHSFPPGSELGIGGFTRLVSLALANAEARADLAAQRARIVTAGDEERRRLERNLHDGAQQRLVSLSLSLRLAQSKLESDPEAATELLTGASAELALALEELRELARGIHPAVLTERGLGPALESLANRATLPVQLEEVPSERLPGQVEATAYYVVSEALANVGKYAEASEVRVRVAQQDGLAIVEVEDDGIGGADPSGGSGLRGLADRVEALEGRLAVESSPGAGTRIRAEIPCG
jgi:PAS domain S-box-containing protein